MTSGGIRAAAKKQKIPFVIYRANHFGGLWQWGLKRQ
jgi:hypothetical protein